MSQPDRVPDERLLELVLAAHAGDAAARAELEALRADPAVDVEARALEDFLGACREDLARPAEPERTAALADRVLARTTREDLSLGGDLRLLRGYVGARLNASAILRLVAASLLLHLMALPVLAWVMIVHSEEKGMFFRFEDPEEPATIEAHEPEVELEDAAEPSLEDLLGDPVPAGDTIETDE